MDKNDENVQEMKTGEETPVVAKGEGMVRSEAFKLTGSGAAWVNAAAIAVAVFFGVMALFGGIALFTNGNWSFGMPGVVGMFAEGWGASTLMLTAMIAVLAGVVGMITLHKITDIHAMKKAWLWVARIFMGIGVLYVVELLTIAVYSLMGIGEKSGVDQGQLWLSGFLPVAIKAATAGALVLIGKAVSEGKTEVLRIMSLVGVGIAGVALILVFVATLVNFYSKSSNSYYGSSYDYSESLRGLFGY